MLILPPHVQRKRPPFVDCRSSRYVIETGLIRSPIIIVDRLPQMIAVAQYWATNSHQPRVRRLQSVDSAARSAAVGDLRVQFRQQLCQNLLGLVVVTGDD